MSQGFKTKYDELYAKPAGETSGMDQDNATYNPGRNVCFVLPEGNRIFLNYGYLVAGEFMPDANMIILTFTSHTITLNGINLKALYYSLMQHMPKEIHAVDVRYNALEEELSIVNKITIKVKE